MPRSKEEINARRKRVEQRGKDLSGYGSTATQLLKYPFLPLNDVTGDKISFPTRDSEPANNYTEPMWQLIRDHFQGEPKAAVEIGSRRGAFAAGLMDDTDNTKIFCIDIWGGRAGRGDLCSWFSRMEKWAFHRAFPMHGSSMFWAGLFPYAFDLVFIDGSRDYEIVKQDMLVWSKLLSNGGLLIGQDYQKEDVKLAANEVFVDCIAGVKSLGPKRSKAFWVKK
jgi:hypothetical protein